MSLEIGATAATAHERAISHKVARGAQRRVPARARDVPFAGVGCPPLGRREVRVLIMLSTLFGRSLTLVRFLFVALPGAWLGKINFLYRFSFALIFKDLATLHIQALIDLLGVAPLVLVLGLCELRLDIAIEARLLDRVVHDASQAFCDPATAALIFVIFGSGSSLHNDATVVAASTHGSSIITNAYFWPEALIWRRRSNQLETILSIAVLHVL